MRQEDSRGSALWGKGEGRWRRAIVCATAVAALCAPTSALAGVKTAEPVQVAAVVEVVEPVTSTESSFSWLANWTW